MWIRTIKGLKNPKKRIRVSLLILYDILVIGISEYTALLIRFEFHPGMIRKPFLESMIHYTPINIGCTLIIFALFSLYESLWRYASVTELLNLVLSCIVSAMFQLVGMYMMGYHLPRSYYILYLLVLLPLMMAGRFSYRLLRIFKQKVYTDHLEKPIITMVIGAGDAGTLIIKELQSSYHLSNKVVCVIDDNPQKKNTKLLGIPIVGGREEILEAVKRYKVQEIIIAIPTMPPKDRKALLEICKDSGCKLRILPGVYQLINEEVSIAKLREVEIEDLLGRDPVETDLGSVLEYVQDKRVLITGGGGSIGSELCRQIAREDPKLLIIFDIYENNAYDIQQELKRKYPYVHVETLIGSVRNTNRLHYIFQTYHPEIIYHAAAHKHVPLMEESPNEAIKNNVLGTLKLSRMAAQYNVKKFVLISTDKAVNPTNIMGASKRLCEMIIQMMNRQTNTDFVAVRFGNVLGSNGSVIPLFKKQIEDGGPVTVTDKRIIRYFMTIPEAVALVLQAGLYAKGGEIFVLDMGEPVKIDDMARNLIRLSGLEPDVDIQIVYTGLRPGEKLYEEMLMSEEGLKETPNKLIHVGEPIEMNDELFEKQLVELEKACTSESKDIKKIVASVVKTYKPDLDD